MVSSGGFGGRAVDASVRLLVVWVVPHHPDNRGGTRGVLDKLKEKCTIYKRIFLRLYGIIRLTSRFGLHETDLICDVYAKRKKIGNSAFNTAAVHFFRIVRRERCVAWLYGT